MSYLRKPRKTTTKFQATSVSSGLGMWHYRPCKLQAVHHILVSNNKVQRFKTWLIEESCNAKWNNRVYRLNFYGKAAYGIRNTTWKWALNEYLCDVQITSIFSEFLQNLIKAEKIHMGVGSTFFRPFDANEHIYPINLH